MDEQRLTRIEDKLDRLTENFSTLVRMDEKIITAFKRMDNHEARQERLSERVHALEVINHRRGPIYVWAERIAIALIGAFVAAAVTAMVKSGVV